MEEKKERLRETIEVILLKTGKHNQDECSELADAIIRDVPQTGSVWVKAKHFAVYLLVYGVDHMPYSENIVIVSDSITEYDQVRTMYPKAKEVHQLGTGSRVVLVGDESAATPPRNRPT